MTPMRLGVPVKLLANPELKSNDTRRWQSNPHLKVSLEYLDAILDDLDRRDIRMYRMSSDLAPYATHPDMPHFHGMVRESASELAAIGAVVIGGASLFGGEGSVLGTVLGTTLLGLILNGLILLGISAYWQQMFSGGIIIAAVALNLWRQQRRR